MAAHREPARTAANGEQQSQKKQGWNGGDAEFPVPVCIAGHKGRNREVGCVAEQDAGDDVDLKCADEATAPLRGGDLRNVHGAEDREAAYAHAADEAEDEQGIPVPRHRAAHGADQIEHGHEAQTVAPAQALGGNAGQHGSQNGADEAGSDGDAELGTAESEEPREIARGAGDGGDVKAEEQAAEGAHQSAAYEICVQFHRDRVRKLATGDACLSSLLKPYTRERAKSRARVGRGL